MVAALSVLDVIAGPAQDQSLTADDRRRIVDEMVAGMLDEHAHIEQIDTFGPRKKSRRCLTRPNHLVFRRLHEDWLARADALRSRAEALKDAGQSVSRLAELQHAMRMTRGLLTLTIEKIEEGMEQIREGNCHTYATVEDLRRDIRAEAERRRADGTGNPGV